MGFVFRDFRKEVRFGVRDNAVEGMMMTEVKVSLKVVRVVLKERKRRRLLKKSERRAEREPRIHPL